MQLEGVLVCWLRDQVELCALCSPVSAVAPTDFPQRWALDSESSPALAPVLQRISTTHQSNPQVSTNNWGLKSFFFFLKKNKENAFYSPELTPGIWRVSSHKVRARLAGHPAGPVTGNVLNRSFLAFLQRQAPSIKWGEPISCKISYRI